MNKTLTRALVFILNIALFYGFLSIKQALEFSLYGNSYVGDVLHSFWYTVFAVLQAIILLLLYRYKVLIKERKQLRTLIITLIILFIYFAVYLPTAPGFF